MIDQARLTEDLRRLLDKELLPALRKRAEREKALDAALREEHAAAKAARRTGQAFEMWREDTLTQVGVAWVLGCVFVRFMEDNGLVDAKDHFPRIAGAGPSKKYAEDQRTDYFRRHGTETDRDYLLWAFTDLAALPACKELFSKDHNPLWAQGGKLMDADAATRLIEFFQQVDGKAEGKLLYDFADASLSTRFLGDLYQNLSEAARKKYALLQTPVFVEEFILDRTLEPAIKEFGLCDQKGRDLSAQKKPVPSDHLLRMIDPTVGSGHFLLGGFERLFAHWQKQEPMTEPAVLAERCLSSLFGVDLNPYAANIARFRLLVAALKACGIKRLREARDWTINIAVGDSLLHGSFAGGTAGGELFEAQVRSDSGSAHVTSAEDLEALRRFLMPHRYHVVVGNPPYITVKDAALSEAYRNRYQSCHGKYALTVPFFERFFDLAVAPEGTEVNKAGFVGKITGNAFMKRGFGKKLIEKFLPRWDLTHVIDTSGAYIPGHGTPTVILFGRHRASVSKITRAVLGIRGEPSTPEDPATAKVWSAILDQIDRPGSESEFVSVTDTPGATFHHHPWAMGGGGASELRTALEEVSEATVDDFCASVGISAFTLQDETFFLGGPCLTRNRIQPEQQIVFINGEDIRDWQVCNPCVALFPYDRESMRPIPFPEVLRLLWPYRSNLRARIMFRQTQDERGMCWYEYGSFSSAKLRDPRTVGYSEVSTHNHFVFERLPSLFKNTAPVLKPSPDSSDLDWMALTGLLNSSAACFWFKQVSHNKGSTVDEAGARQRTTPFEDFYQVPSGTVARFPTPAIRPTDLGELLDTLAQARAKALPTAILAAPGPAVVTRAQLDGARGDAGEMLRRMIAHQEELDWLVYRAYGLLDDTKAEHAPAADTPPINLGERAFEIVMARRMEAGTLQTEWFRRHGSTPITAIPTHWPAAYKKVVEHRISLIEAGPKQNKDIALIEQPEYKRRWNTEKWEEMEERALREWLLDRLEWGTRTPSSQAAPGEASRSTIWNEAEPQVMTAGRLADLVRTDAAFMQVAALYRGRTDFDMSDLVAELVADESVPFLPSLRYKESGLTKRRVWERTWELQREEDRLEALRVVARNKLAAAEAAIIERALSTPQRTIEQLKATLAKDRETLTAAFLADVRFDESVLPEKLAAKLNRDGDPACGKLVDAIASAAEKLRDLESDFRQKLADLKKEDRAWNAAARELDAVPANPDIEVPPRYTSADFVPGPAWRLRGKLDVPKERFVSLPHCGPDADPTMLIMWAGFDHRQQALAIATYYQDRKDNAGWDKARFVPLLAGLIELLPWVKQWHGEPDAGGTEWGAYFESFVNDEARWLGLTLDQIRAWQPPASTRGRKGKSKAKAALFAEADGEND